MDGDTDYCDADFRSSEEAAEAAAAPETPLDMNWMAITKKTY